MRNKAAPHIDFEELTGLLGKIVPSNIDMMYERKGKFLVGEWKRVGEKISTGQEILLKALAARQDFEVIIINGDTDTGMNVGRFWKLDRFGLVTEAGRGIQSLKDYIVDWYIRADEGI
jgi:hypothetical protein